MWHLDEVLEISDVAAQVEDESGPLDLLSHVVLRSDAIRCDVERRSGRERGGGGVHSCPAQP